ncbi:hypothetical protein CPB84DRAFT_1774576 [Gymnopilus junonius]|uniref:Uncharacterized protein n=1 Tax=Gymnopilus junonius TaxID=109634 RepID=A0A9P5NNS0_GYMJU|nr:hypothetical protein CPB84DRAFT_1774576 [Gymnopilus junonius]
MSTPITRETFISSDHVKVAAANPTMVKLSADGEGIEDVPVPASIKETGILPDGYSVDFILDPIVVIKALAKQDITTVEQLSDSLLDDLKEKLNSPENLKIVPTSIYEEKLAIATSDESEE